MTTTMNSHLPYIEVNPKIPAIGSVIWLHGLGANGNDFAPLVPELHLPDTLPIRFIFPHAPQRPVTINNGYVMPAWYDIVSINMEKHADEKDIAESVKQIQSLIAQEEKLGIPSEKIVLAGFSQGAVIALTTGLCFPRRLAGILALSGYLPYANELIAKATPENKKIPIFLAHGTEDTIVPYFTGQATHNLLEKNNFTVDWHSYPMPHSVCLEEIRDIAEWLKRVF